MIAAVDKNGHVHRLAFAGAKSALPGGWRGKDQAITFERHEKFVAAALQRKRVHIVMEGTDFQHSVWAALTKIPAGTTVTYADVARRIGRPGAVRAVGTACGANPVPLLVPCHRVVASDGSLGGFSGGLAVKKKLLRAEACAAALKKKRL